MKKYRSSWNIVDVFFKIFTIILLIFIIYIFCEYQERYIFRYTLFPALAVFLTFILGIVIGKDLEKTKNELPIGYFSKKAFKKNKARNVLVFSDNKTIYSPKKKVIDEIKSGEKVHIKQRQINVFEQQDAKKEDFKDLYSISLDDLIDKSDKENKD